MDFNGFKNSNKRGTFGLADAIYWFTANQYVVSVPLNDTQKYDLVVEKDGVLQRVSVKTVSHKPRGIYVVKLKQQTIRYKKLFDNSKIELLYVVSDSGERWCIPSSTINGKSVLNLGQHYDEYKITLSSAIG